MAKSKVVKGKATLHLSSYGKQQVALAMFSNGKAYLKAAFLLKEKGGDGYVVLHLVCQSIELIMKSLLLRKNYNTYSGKIKGYGHDLKRVIRKVLLEYDWEPLPETVKAELKKLNKLYSSHYLRYASGLHVLVDPSTISAELVLSYLQSRISAIDAAFAQ
jgi:HEPN domain-containing protein